MKELVSLLGFLLLPALLSCSGGGAKSSTAAKDSIVRKQELTTLLKGNQCAAKKEQQLLIKNESDFATQWKQTFDGFDMAPAKPEVNFSKYWVVFATMGEVSHGGFEIEAKSIVEDSGIMIINIQHKIPGNGCFTTQEIEYPFIFAQIEQYPSLMFEFRIEKVIYSCK